MGKASKPLQRKNKAEYFGLWPFVMVSDELRASCAWKELYPQEKLVLIDMMRVYGGASCGSDGYIPGGFDYTYAMCVETCNRNTFYAAINKILDHGFFETPADIQPTKPLASRRFIPSKNWKHFNGNDSTAKAEACKAKTQARDQERKRKFLDTLKQNPVPTTRT